MSIEYKRLRLWGKDKDRGIELSCNEDDTLDITYEEYYCGESDEEETPSISIKDLFLHLNGKGISYNVKKLVEERKKLQTEIRELEVKKEKVLEEVEKIKEALKTFKE